MKKYFKELERLIKEVDKKAINKAVDILYAAWLRGKTVYVMGCGGSASTATHFVCDLAKCTIVKDKPRIKTMALVDNIPLVSAWTNDNGWESVFAEQLEPWLYPGDVLVGFSVHGGSSKWSGNLTKAMRLAKDRDIKVIGFAGFDGGAMKELADACIVVPIDKEPLATPLVESFHVVLHHLICAILLKEKIERG